MRSELVKRSEAVLKAARGRVEETGAYLRFESGTRWDRVVPNLSVHQGVERLEEYIEELRRLIAAHLQLEEARRIERWNRDLEEAARARRAERRRVRRQAERDVTEAAWLDDGGSAHAS